MASLLRSKQSKTSNAMWKLRIWLYFQMLFLRAVIKIIYIYIIYLIFPYKLLYFHHDPYFTSWSSHSWNLGYLGWHKHIFDYLTILAERGIDLDLMAGSSRPQVSCQVSDCSFCHLTSCLTRYIWGGGWVLGNQVWNVKIPGNLKY